VAIAEEPDPRMTSRRGVVADRLEETPSVQRCVRTRDDAAMVARSVGEPDRFAEVYDMYFDEIYRYLAARLGPDAADDLAAETFLVAFRKRDRFEPALGRVRPWLYGIATNLVGAHRRKETRRYRALAREGGRLLEVVESHDERVAEAVTAERLAGRLAVALAGLGRGDRDVLLLVAISELSHHEIALALQIPYGTVGSRLNRTRRTLRAVIEGAGLEEVGNG
jgi:RNA polymerase sigma-70 factor (ECF subfamily)